MTIYTMIARTQNFAMEQPKLFKKILLAAGVLVLALIILACSGSGRTTLDMADYTEVYFSGSNGQGYAQVAVDYYAMAEFLSEDNNSDTLKNMEMVYGPYAATYVLSDYLRVIVSAEVDANYELSNGDKVSIVFDVDDDLCKELGIKIKAENMKVKVHDLQKVN